MAPARGRRQPGAAPPRGSGSAGAGRVEPGGTPGLRRGCAPGPGTVALTCSAGEASARFLPRPREPRCVSPRAGGAQRAVAPLARRERSPLRGAALGEGRRCRCPSPGVSPH